MGRRADEEGDMVRNRIDCYVAIHLEFRDDDALLHRVILVQVRHVANEQVTVACQLELVARSDEPL
jgi:hypothetical protein